MTSTSTRPGWRRWAFLLPLCACACWHFWPSPPDWHDDRWYRKDLDKSFPAGPSSQSLLLVNSGNVPMFIEIRSPDWATPRPELLLPNDSQFVDLPSLGEQATEVRIVALDLQARGVERLIELPSGCNSTFADIEPDGMLTLDQRTGGDMWPARGLFAIDSAYPLPVRLAVPFDKHERPSLAHMQRREWIGPGTGDDSDGCAYTKERSPVATAWVPRLDAPVNTLMVTPADGAIRITVRPDGTVQRDAIPALRRLARLASL